MSNDTAQNGNGQQMVKPDRQTSPVKALQSYLGARQKNLASYVAGRLKPDMLVRLALFEFSQNEWLQRCTLESIYGALVLAAQLGLEPSGVKGHAYLVPFKGKCTLIPGWRGLVHLALKSKAVKSLYSHVVYERDEFMVELGSEPRVVHRPCIDDDRGDIRCAYAVAIMENGAIDVEVMPIAELEKIRENASRTRGGKDGPAYQEWADQMYRKAPLRRLAKRLPLGEDFYLAAKADELADAGEPEKIQQFIDAEYSEGPPQNGAEKFDSVASKVRAKAEQARGEDQS